MLFRRIAGHLRAQNWLAVVLDLLIVIVGIFIGLQVNAWNEARKDAQREAGILDRLRADFTEIRAEADAAVEEHIKTIDGLIAVLQAASAASLPEEDVGRFVYGLENALKFDPGARRSATWVDIVSSGQTALLRDPALRSALSQYDELHQNAKPLFAQFWEGQRVHEVVFGRHFEYGTDRGKVGKFYMAGEVATYDVAAMAGDTEFLFAAQRLTEYQSYYQFWHMRMRSAADEVLALLAAAPE